MSYELHAVNFDELPLTISLRAARADGGTIQPLVAGQDAPSWLVAALNKLGQLLVLSRLEEAGELSHLVREVLQVSNHQSVTTEAFDDAIRRLTGGVSAALAQDHLGSLQLLEPVTTLGACPSALKWAAWIWICRAFGASGELQRAHQAVQLAISLADGVDEWMQIKSEEMLAEVASWQCDYEQSITHFSNAIRFFLKRQDAHSLAYSWLGKARALAGLGRSSESEAAARQAQAADMYWEQPTLFLARQALLAGELDRADNLLKPLRARRNPSVDVQKEQRLVDAVRLGHVPVPVVEEYLELRERPPSSIVVALLDGLVKENPDFLVLRELLAWNFAKLGRNDEAAEHFNWLAARPLTPELQASVFLGLGCLANRRHAHRHPGGVVHATVHAVQQPVPSISQSIPIVSSVQLADQRPARLTPVMMSDDPASAAFVDEFPTVIKPANASGPKAVGQSTTTQPGVTKPRTGSESAEAIDRAAFTGDLQLLAVPDLLEFLKSSRRTGTLVVTSEHGIGAVYLRNGMLAGAASPNTPTIGALLKDRSLIDDSHLTQAAQLQRIDLSEELLGGILARLGEVAADRVRDVLAEQICGVLQEIAAWNSGRFAFEPAKPGDTQTPPIDISLDTQSVLLEALRRLDEKSRAS